MLFCDPKYFAIFLPIAAFLYWFSIGKGKFRWTLPLLMIASTVFYATWSIKFFVLLTLSACINYAFGYFLLTYEKERTNKRKLLLILGILFNVGLLGYFKYFNFFVDNCNHFFGTQWNIPKIILPLGDQFLYFPTTCLPRRCLQTYRCTLFFGTICTVCNLFSAIGCRSHCALSRNDPTIWKSTSHRLGINVPWNYHFCYWIG